MLHRNEFHAMGSSMLALVDCESEPPGLAEVPAWFEEWEQVLSRFRSDSELTKLNSGSGVRVRVSQVLWDVYQASIIAEAETGGLVSPLVLDALLSAGYDRSFDFMPNGAVLEPFFPNVLDFAPAASGAPTQLAAITADRASRSLSLPPGALLDFGGVAKGWAAEQAASRLAPCGPSLVSAGGDIAVTGPRADSGPWQIGVEDPFHEGACVHDIFIEHGGVATSGRDRRRWIRNGIPQHHIIDPRNGLPAQTDILTATVIADSAPRAEAMAKAALISGRQAALAWIDADDNLAALLILENGERLYSRNMDKYL